MPSELIFSYIMVRTSYVSMKWWWCSLCTRPTHLVGQQSAYRHVARAHYPDSEPTNLCSYSLTLHALGEKQWILFL